ncbi:APC family permease [Alienimonas californiensis]|uniref:Serine/threonine exchanger SteT n=1 Tax=Alienimonas californiensis TaxID=2527989 RepID=A0A517P612_9PLAN|nr:APC family permease [Alienimonas californiensis]QDT14821.1 Serine/threonine exchanger SteT [Alienimonas californiensis]
MTTAPTAAEPGEPESGNAGGGSFNTAALAAVVAASMIGAGVWTTSGYTLAALGTPERVMLVWALGGALALCGAAAYGGLAERVRGSGGEYLFLARTVHPLAGFLAGWVSLLAGFTGAAAFAGLVLEGYLWPDRPEDVPPGLVAAAAVLLCGALHALTPRGGTRTQTVVVAAKLALITLFCLYAGDRWLRGYFVNAATFPMEPPADAPAGWALIAALAGQLVWISASYSGFNAAVYVAGEARDPGRSVPRAMLWGTAAVTVLYLLLNAVFVFAPPIERVAGQNDVAAVAARFLGGGQLEFAVRAVICIGLVTSLSALVQTGPRVYAKMAADGLFPLPKLFRLREDGSAPPSTVLLQAALVAALCLSGTTIRGWLDYLGLTLSLSAAGAVACLFLLKSRGEPVPAWRLACGAVFVLATVGLAAVKLLNPPAWFHPLGPPAGLAATVISGAVLYWAFAAWKDPQKDRPVASL